MPSPWSTYSGVEVDPYYLWVFGPTGFACATHASVIKCLQKKIPKPSWIEFHPNDILGDQSNDGGGNMWLVDGYEIRGGRPPLKGLISLSPCTDGTLFISLYNRTVTQTNTEDHWLFRAFDDLHFYGALYSVDPKAKTIHVEPWEKYDQGLATQVQKMPIPCWALLENLKADLKRDDSDTLRRRNPTPA